MCRESCSKWKPTGREAAVSGTHRMLEIKEKRDTKNPFWIPDRPCECPCWLRYGKTAQSHLDVPPEQRKTFSNDMLLTDRVIPSLFY